MFLKDVSHDHKGCIDLIEKKKNSINNNSVKIWLQ